MNIFFGSGLKSPRGFADFALQNMVETTLPKGLSGFWVFLDHPPMASVLLSASVERCFVSRMRDFYIVFTYFASSTGYEEDIFTNLLKLFSIWMLKDQNLAENLKSLFMIHGSLSLFFPSLVACTLVRY